MAAPQSTLRRRLRWLSIISLTSLVVFGWWLLKPHAGIDPSPRFSASSSFSMDHRSRPEVTTRQGRIMGIEVSNGFPQPLEQFLGIPYALPPTGDRRFRGPVPVNAYPRTTVLEAASYGFRCPAGAPDSDASQDEDCLNLNIFRPKNRPVTANLPVVIYVHGGSFNFGAGNARPISSLVAWSTEPILGVSFNYRLGALGFLSGGLAAREGALNLGLRDQALLFEWVQENIEDFGGDPENVTLMGTSAGAHAIGHHLLLHTSKPPPFHKVIMESGAPTARAVYPFNHSLHEAQFREFLTLLDCDGIPEPQILPTLRQLPIADIKRASESIYHKYDLSVRWPWQPVIDGAGGMIPLRPIDAWRSGTWHKVPILTGFTTDEGSMFVPPETTMAEEFTAFFHRLLPILSSTDLDALNMLYPTPASTHSSFSYSSSPSNSHFTRLSTAYSHFAYISPVLQTAQFASHHVPVYVYHFAARSDRSLGAYHSSHMPFVSYSEEVTDVSENVERIAKEMHAAWTSFIVGGEVDGLVGSGRVSGKKWPVFKTSSTGSGFGGAGGAEKIVVFGKGNDEVAGGGEVGVVMDVSSVECGVEAKWWWEVKDRLGL